MQGEDITQPINFTQLTTDKITMKKIILLAILIGNLANAQIIGGPEHKMAIQYFNKNPGKLSSLASQYSADTFGKCLAVNNQFNISVIKKEVEADEEMKFYLALDFEGLAAARKKLLASNIPNEILVNYIKKYSSQISNSNDRQFSQMIKDCAAIRNRVID